MTTDKRLYNQIARRITAMIDEGKFPPGSRLPGERDLAVQLGVSRVTVREAQIALQAQGRIEVRTGSGAKVLPTAPAKASFNTSSRNRAPNVFAAGCSFSRTTTCASVAL